MSDEKPLLTYTRYNIAEYNMAISAIVKMVQSGDLDLTPWYQRGSVWELPQKQALIDSAISGLGIPGIFLRRLEMKARGTYLEVIDGKQRITTFVEYLDSKFPYQDLYYRDLNEIDQRVWLMHLCIPVKMVSDLTDEQAVEIFERVNFNGVNQDRAAYEARKQARNQ